MAKEVILMDKVKHLGEAGDIVTVKDGYARNFLMPRKLAAPVTEVTKRQLATLQRQREEAAKAALADAQALVSKLEGVSVTLPVKTKDGENLYGSIGAANIATALQEQGYAIERDQVDVSESIKALGVFDVTITLAANVQTTIKVWVVEE